MDVCTDILNEGKNSRLYRSLVIEQQIAQSVIAYQHGLEQTGRTVLQITPQPGHSLDEVHLSAMSIIDQLSPKVHGTRGAKVSEHEEVAPRSRARRMLQRADGLASCHTLGGSAGSSLPISSDSRDHSI